MGDRLLLEGGELVLNRLASDMLSLIGSGGGDAIAADNSAESSLRSGMNLDPLPLREFLTGDVDMSIVLTSESRPLMFGFFSRVEPWADNASSPDPGETGSDFLSRDGSSLVEFPLLYGTAASKIVFFKAALSLEVPFER